VTFDNRDYVNNDDDDDYEEDEHYEHDPEVNPANADDTNINF
jgi:hypothetical protein